MNDKKIITNQTIKTEPVSPTSKKILLSGSLFPQSTLKKEIPTRLPSFKPPRDLLLAGSATSHTSPILKDFINPGSKANKKKYTPNVNVFRKKGGNNAITSNTTTESEAKHKNVDQSKKSPVANKKRSANFIQTKGVFSEGLAPGKVKAFQSACSERNYNGSNILEKPKLVLNQKINKSHEDEKLQSLLKDDFIEDPSNMPDLNFIPNSLPTFYNDKEKLNDPRDIEKTFQTLQVKVDKLFSAKSEDKACKTEVFDAFQDSDSPKLLLFEFPKILQNFEDSEGKKKVSKTQSTNETESKTRLGNISSAGEGHWGYLRIHENGNAYFVVGSTIIPISIYRHLPRQELMSTYVDQSRCRGEIINLGTIDASFTCSTNFEDIH